MLKTGVSGMCYKRKWRSLQIKLIFDANVISISHNTMLIVDVTSKSFDSSY